MTNTTIRISNNDNMVSVPMINNKAVTKKEFVEYSICKNHSKKMRGMQSISTSALENTICCERAKNCDSVCSKCYARRMLKHYHTLATKVSRNHYFYTSEVLTDSDVPIINTSIFRFESFGELQNTTQLMNYCTIARVNADTRFTLWTKNLFIIADYIDGGGVIPDNMSIIYSAPKLNTPHDDTLVYLVRSGYIAFVNAVFTVWTDENTAEAHGVTINCGHNNCIECRRCYTLNHDTLTFIDEKLK